MGDQLNKTTASLKQFWKKQSKKMKAIISAVGVGVLAIAVAGVLMLNYREFAVVYKDLDPAETETISAQIEDMGVPVKRDKAGAILVPADQSDMVIMKLTMLGYPKTGYNYNQFTDNVDFMTTEFDKKVYYKMMLQENLGKQISTIQNVKSALVTLNIPEQSDFVIKENVMQPTAAVVITTMPSAELNSQQIQAIEQLIMKSLPGLIMENISIVDASGKLLSSENGVNSENDVHKQRLQLQRDIENAMRLKVLDQLVSIYGRDNVSVSASVILDFDRIKSEDQKFTPSYDNSGMIIHKDESTKTETNSSVNGIPGADNNAEIPGYPDLNNESSSGTTDKTLSEDYAVNSFIQQFEKDGYYIKDASIGVAINSERMTPTQIESMVDLISKSAGIPDKNVSVYPGVFTKEPPVVVDNTQQVITFAIIGVTALICILILVGVLLGSAKKKKQRKVQLEMERRAAEQTMQWLAQGLGPDGKPLPIEEVPQIELVETKEQVLKKEIKDFASSNPEIAAQLLRTWIGDEADG